MSSPSTDPAVSDVVLETHAVSKAFGGFAAVNKVSLKVRRGAVHGLIGPNGAGKTTFFNLLTRFLPPSGGSIFFKQRDITGLKAASIARMGLVRSFQVSATFPNMSALENVRVALRSRQGESFDFWRSVRVLRQLDDEAFDLLDQVGLADFADVGAAGLSYGRKRALELATTMALDPEMLLLDEPTAGMGHEDIDRIVKLVDRVAQNRTVLMVEHNLHVVSSLCDRLTVMARGEILSEGDYRTVSNDPRVIEAYLGGSMHAGA